MPDIVSLHTTEVCNLRCVMCLRSEVPGVAKLDRESLAQALETLFPAARLTSVSGFLGEPMLSDWDLVVEAAQRFGVGVDLVTNGTVMSVERYREARGVLNRLNVSLDSVAPAIYERVRVGSSWPRVRSHLEQIREERARRPDDVWLSLSAVVMRTTLDGLPDFIRLAAELGADEVSLQPLRHDAKALPDEDPFLVPGKGRLPPSGGNPSPYLATDSDRDPLVRMHDEVRRVAREARINLTFNDFGLPPELARPLRLRVPIDYDERNLCWNVTRNFALFPNGDVYPCCHPTDHVLGNVRRTPVAEIWNGAAARALRQAHLSRRGTVFCRGCLHAPYLDDRPPGRATRWLRRSRLAWSDGRRYLGLR